MIPTVCDCVQWEDVMLHIYRKYPGGIKSNTPTVTKYIYLNIEVSYIFFHCAHRPQVCVC